MKRLLLLLQLLLLVAGAAWPASGGTLITATVIITNTAGTTDGQTITVNSDTRTWKSTIVTPASQIQTTNSIGWAATNLFNHAADAPFLNLSVAGLTNGISLQTLTINGPLVVSVSSGWAAVTLATNTLTAAIDVRVPLSVEYPTNQTNIASQLVQGLESSTYSLSATAPAAANYVSLSQAQTITGQKTIVTPIITNALIQKSFLDSPTLTNGINRGNAFSSPSTNFAVSAENFGLGAQASGIAAQAFGAFSIASANGADAYGFNAQATNVQSSAFGWKAIAGGVNSTALGAFALGTGTSSLASGNGATASQTNTTAVGQGSTASAVSATALGQGATSAFNNSTAVGQGATTTDAGQIMIGQAGQYAVFPGNVSFSGRQTNITAAGINNFPASADIAFGRSPLSSLANGNNADLPVGTNVFVELSGPSGAFTVNGIAGGRDGKFLILLNRTGFNMTIAHDSGVDATPANRIYCLTGADKTLTGNSAATLIYNANNSRWILLSLTQ